MSESRGLDERTVAEIERRAQAHADALPLENEGQLAAAVEAQLRRLDESETHRPNIHKKRVTALALAQVGITVASKEEVFDRPDTVSRRVFYSTNKGWWSDPVFREVAETLQRLYRKWAAGSAAREAAAEFVAREAELREKEWEVSRNLTRLALEMAGTPLYEVVTLGDQGEDVTLKPARWTFDTVPRLADAASKLGRLSLGMTPGGRQEVEINWQDHLPPGVTPAQAEAVKVEMARRLAMAAEAAGADEDDEEDG